MRVLIVDDEEMIRSLAARILQRSGFESVTAENGCQGLDEAKSDPLIEVAIIDMTLPDINGIELIRRIRSARPELPCIVSTGQVMLEPDFPIDIPRPLFMLPKPYRAQELVDLIYKVTGTQRIGAVSAR